MQHEFDQFKQLSQKEIGRLRAQQSDILAAISVAKSDLISETGRSSARDGGFHTMTSDFSMDAVDVEELRQQLSAASIELEEQKEHFKKHFSKNHKEIE